MKHPFSLLTAFCGITICAVLSAGCSGIRSSSQSTLPALSEDFDNPESSSEEIPVITIDESNTPLPAPDAESSSDNAVSDNSFFGYELSEEEKADPRTICKETEEEGKAVLLFTGDVALDDNWSNMTALRGRKNGIHDTLSPELMLELNNADICMINNEFPYSNRGTPTEGKKFTFRADPSRVEILQQMGVDIVSLANNHAYDFGPDALMDTFSTLESAGIAYVGAGRNLSEAMLPTYFIAGGQKIAFVSATQIERYDPSDTKEATDSSPGVLRTLNPDKFLSVIERAEQNSDFVVVYVHWGSENTYDVEASQHELADAYIDAGADLIIGDHSHCLQGFEYRNEVPVLYSLGNFWFNSKNLDTGMLKVTVSSGNIESIEFLPCLQHDCKTDLLLPGTDGEYERILGVMAGLSTDISISKDGFIQNGAGSGIEPVEPRPIVKRADTKPVTKDPTVPVISADEIIPTP